MSSNKVIIKLENNKEYFELQNITKNNTEYCLIVNVDNESDIKIVKKVNIDDEQYIIDVLDENLLEELKSTFKNMTIEEEKKYK